MVISSNLKRAGLLIIAVSAIAPVLIISYMVIFTDNESIHLTFDTIIGSLIVWYYLLLIFVGVVTSVSWLVRQIKAIIRLKKEKTKAELLHLKAQVNPHFFFNTLNNLYGWVGKDPGKAQQLILKLADMMRYSIYEGQKDTVSLRDEINFLKDYTDLHRMRYHKKVEIIFEEEMVDESARLTPLLFIILLENAFKHGVEALRKDAFIHLRLTTTKEKIRLRISNRMGEKIHDSPGIGLRNLKRRLELAYPRSHHFSASERDGVFTANLTLARL